MLIVIWTGQAHRPSNCVLGRWQSYLFSQILASYLWVLTPTHHSSTDTLILTHYDMIFWDIIFDGLDIYQYYLCHVMITLVCFIYDVYDVIGICMHYEDYFSILIWIDEYVTLFWFCNYLFLSCQKWKTLLKWECRMSHRLIMEYKLHTHTCDFIELLMFKLSV